MLQKKVSWIAFIVRAFTALCIRAFATAWSPIPNQNRKLIADLSNLPHLNHRCTQQLAIAQVLGVDSHFAWCCELNVCDEWNAKNARPHHTDRIIDGVAMFVRDIQCFCYCLFFRSLSWCVRVCVVQFFIFIIVIAVCEKSFVNFVWAESFFFLFWFDHNDWKNKPQQKIICTRSTLYTCEIKI